jgi:hypothetical protein
MRYLIFMPQHTPCFTNYFDAQNIFVDGMIVVDLLNQVFTTDGEVWENVELDHL